MVIHVTIDDFGAASSPIRYLVRRELIECHALSQRECIVFGLEVGQSISGLLLHFPSVPSTRDCWLGERDCQTCSLMNATYSTGACQVRVIVSATFQSSRLGTAGMGTHDHVELVVS